MIQRNLFDQAVARRTDPKTSWEAAKSIKPERIRASQNEIIALLRDYGNMTDGDIWDFLGSYWRQSHEPSLSPSGARTRRKELVDMGLVEDSGKRKRTKSGRKSIVWRLK